MAKIKCSTVKKANQAGSPLMKASLALGPVTEFQFIDNGDSTCTVSGVSGAGNVVDISGVATLTPPPASSDTAKVTVDPPVGMTFTMHAVGPLTDPGSPVVITTTATWNDGSQGPYTFDLPVDVIAGGPKGIQVVPGPVTEHNTNPPAPPAPPTP